MLRCVLLLCSFCVPCCLRCALAVPVVPLAPSPRAAPASRTPRVSRLSEGEERRRGERRRAHAHRTTAVHGQRCAIRPLTGWPNNTHRALRTRREATAKRLPATHTAEGSEWERIATGAQRNVGTPLSLSASSSRHSHPARPRVTASRLAPLTQPATRRRDVRRTCRDTADGHRGACRSRPREEVHAATESSSSSSRGSRSVIRTRSRRSPGVSRQSQAQSSFGG